MHLKAFGQKAHTFITRPVAEDTKFTLLEGSVRSSKTIAMLIKLFLLNDYQVGGQRVITGASKSSIYKNILMDLFDTVGKGNYNYSRSSGELWLFGVRWWVIGAKDEGSERLIRGMTIGIVYSDETVLMPKSFFMQLIARMSPPGARFYGTTNPDNPYHYLMTELIQKDLRDSKGNSLVTIIHFTLDDNPNLSIEQRQFYETFYTGVFYLRMVLGLWVIAEGAIYRDVLGPQCAFNDATRPAGLHTAYAARYIPVDYGTHNPCTFSDVYDYQGRLWEDREYYWDSQKEMRQKTDAEYADDFEAFVGPNRRGVIAIVDPSAASFKLALQKRGFLVKDAKNDVSPGIMMTSSALKVGAYKIHENNKITNKEMSTYSWDKKAGLKGEEAPIKAHDHAPDRVRYCINTVLTQARIGAIGALAA